ncbi:hypothetical protein IFM89_038668 [Coptis chinensis]|uniref:Uncharacterized protein n=1 Tax=Coptis chinensis TaxID=261450 RepID=A0A835I7M0_9MAGN|nr:hypothetical protein IFM89_038668 [Coptis chinensis]
MNQVINSVELVRAIQQFRNSTIRRLVREGKKAGAGVPRAQCLNGSITSMREREETTQEAEILYFEVDIEVIAICQVPNKCGNGKCCGTTVKESAPGMMEISAIFEDVDEPKNRSTEMGVMLYMVARLEDTGRLGALLRLL